MNLPQCSSAFERLIYKTEFLYKDLSTCSLLPLHDIEVSKIALPEKLEVQLDLLQVLPDVLSKFYSLESNLVSSSLDDWQKARKFKAKLRMPHVQYLLLLLRLYRLNIIQWLRQDEVKMVNGLQCVVKPNGKQRLIFDGRAVNCVLGEPAKVTLPGFHLLDRWEMREGESMVISKLDIDNYYHRLSVPSWMISYLALPPVRRTDLLSLDPLFPLFDDGLLFPACRTLPMGLAHAVYLAQNVHLHICAEHSLAPIINWEVPTSASSWCMIYIDDVVVATKHHDAKVAVIQNESFMHQFLQIYKAKGLIVNSNKILRAVSNAPILGCMVDGENGIVFPMPDKLMALIQATRFLGCRVVKKKWVERLLGHWVWWLLLKRSLFACLVNVYKFLHSSWVEKFRVLWDSVKKEFELLIAFADLLSLSWRRKWDSIIIASDASLTGGGACFTAGSAAGMEIIDLPLQLQSCWTPIFQTRWNFPEHINVLEARAVLLAFYHLLSNPQRHHSRLRILLNSQVVFFALKR